MIKSFFKNLFKKNKKTSWKDMPGSDFSNFFHYATEEEQRELFTRVMKKANKRQQEVIKRAEEIMSKSA